MSSSCNVPRAVVIGLVLAATGVAGCKEDEKPDPPREAGPAEAGPGDAAVEMGAGDGGGDAGVFGLTMYVGCANATGDIQQYMLGTPGGGALTMHGTTSAGSPTSNSALHPNRRILYVNHRTEGKISAFAIGSNGALTAMGSVPVPYNVGQLPDAGAPDAGGDAGADAGADGGADASAPPPSNPSTQTLEVDSAGRFLLAPNYEAHTTLVFRLETSGSVGGLASWQTSGMRAHHTLISPNNKFVLVPYLGSHLIAIYGFDAATGAIQPHGAPVTVPGTTPGPRHVSLHPNGKWLYVINETNGTLSLFNFDQAAGTLTHVESVSSIQPTYTGMLKNASEVIVAPSGKFVYVSNRLDNMVDGSLGAFAINPTDGKVTPVGFESSRGKTPRHFTLSPDGSLLVAANQNSNNLAVFTVDATTGALSFVQMRDVCMTPFFVRILPR